MGPRLLSLSQTVQSVAKPLEAQTMGTLLQALLFELLEHMHGVVVQGLPLQGH